MVMIIALQQLEPDITLEGISTVMYIFNFEYTFAFHEKTPKSWHKRVELLWIFHESKGCKNTYNNEMMLTIFYFRLVELTLYLRMDFPFYKM